MYYFDLHFFLCALRELRGYKDFQVFQNTICRLLILFTIITLPVGFSFAQEKEEEPPERQIPVEERDTGDSIGEIIAQAPGKIVTFPLRLFFRGVSTAAGVIDYNNVVLRVTDWLTSEDGSRRVRPIFTPLSGGGLVYIDDNFLKEDMRFRTSAAFGTRTRRNFSAALQDRHFFARDVGLEFQGLYNRLPDEDFFGIGNGSVTQNQTDYLYDEVSVDFKLVSRLLGFPYVSTGVSFSDVTIENGRDPNFPSLLDSAGVFFEEPIPGLNGGQMWTLAVKFFRDTRNETGNPTKGSEAYLSISFSESLDGKNFGFRKYVVDLRKYVELFYSRVLVLRVNSEITDNFEGELIPFYRLSELGGRDRLRGYRPYRFRDKDLLLGGLEYRFPIHFKIAATLFFEEARVFNNIFDEFTLDGFKYSYGGGLRFLSGDGSLSAVLEFAKSAEQFRFSFGLNTELTRF